MGSFRFAFCLSAFVVGSGAAASAAIVVDGTLDGSYSTPTVVTYDPLAPNSNFSTPTNASSYIGYSVYTAHDSSYWYGYFQPNTLAGGTSVGAFANLYFDLDPVNANGSDVGFEISSTQRDAFIPGVSGNQLTPDILVAAGSDGSLEIGIPDHYFVTALAGLSYAPGQEFISPTNPTTVLRLSQTFGYSVAGGPSYGPDRLGAQNLFAAVPEPASWIMLILGFAGIGGMLRFARRQLVPFA